MNNANLWGCEYENKVNQLIGEIFMMPFVTRKVHWTTLYSSIPEVGQAHNESITMNIGFGDWDNP